MRSASARRATVSWSAVWGAGLSGQEKEHDRAEEAIGRIRTLPLRVVEQARLVRVRRGAELAQLRARDADLPLEVLLAAQAHQKASASLSQGGGRGKRRRTAPRSCAAARRTSHAALPPCWRPCPGSSRPSVVRARCVSLPCVSRDPRRAEERGRTRPSSLSTLSASFLRSFSTCCDSTSCCLRDEISSFARASSDSSSLASDARAV